MLQANKVNSGRVNDKIQVCSMGKSRVLFDMVTFVSIQNKVMKGRMHSPIAAYMVRIWAQNYKYIGTVESSLCTRQKGELRDMVYHILS